MTFRTNEGYDCMLKMQVTSVQRPLISVSSFCRGPSSRTHKPERYMQHEGIVRVTAFYRYHNVVRMAVELVGRTGSAFTRQGE